MIKTELSKNFYTSPLGLGVMRYNPNDMAQFQKNIDYAISQGVNYFEACYFYLNFNCENLLSKALNKYPRDTYLLIDKMPLQGILNNSTPEEVFSKQLKNCNTDYFDGYLLQALDRNSIFYFEKYDLINYLDNLKKQGYINKVGFSFHDTPEYLEYFLKLYDWDYIQLQLNYYDWFLSFGQELYNIADKNNINIVAMGPLKGGTIVNNLPLESIKLLNDLDYQKSIASWGMRFLMNLPRVKTILTGAEQFDMLQENIELFNDEENFKLNNNELKIIEQAINLYREKNYIECTGCNYCHCPRNINISKTFYLYNQVLKNKNNFEEMVSFLKNKNSPLDCIHCQQCEKFCPQHLPIAKYMYEKIFPMRA